MRQPGGGGKETGEGTGAGGAKMGKQQGGIVGLVDVYLGKWIVLIKRA